MTPPSIDTITTPSNDPTTPPSIDTITTPSNDPTTPPSIDPTTTPSNDPSPTSYIRCIQDLEHQIITRFDDVFKMISLVNDVVIKVDKKIDDLSERFDKYVSKTQQSSNIITIEKSPIKPQKSSNDKKAEVDEPYPEDYPGKMSLSEEQRDLIHHRMSSTSTRNHIAFNAWNIIGVREAMEDLLFAGYVADCHVDAFAKILELRRLADDKSLRNFIYVSPNLWLLNQKVHDDGKIAGLQLYASHLTKSTFASSTIIFMPVCRNNHWFLLVGAIKTSTWIVHDSLSNPQRKELAREPIRVLQMAAAGNAETDFTQWKLTLAKEIPRQKNVVDCGVFVMKYMEHIARRDTTGWKDCKDWPQKMSFYRAEIAYEIFKYFGIET